MAGSAAVAADPRDLFFEDDEATSAAELTQKALIDTQERMGMMLDLMPMGLLIHTQQGILFANQEACRMLRIGQAQAVGHHFLDFVAPNDIASIGEQFDASFNARIEMHSRESRIVHRDGTEVHIKLISCRLPWQGTPVIQVLLQDVSDLKRTEQKLRRMTITDEMTGAYNRRHAFYEASLYIDPERSDRIALSAIMVDVDHFKHINDAFGHASGDLALIALTNAANEVIRTQCHGDSAMFARIGGEEFLLLLPGVELERAMALAEQLRHAIAQLAVDTPSGPLRLTISSGVATFGEADRTFDALLSRCDAALYRAKDAGRNRVVAG
ncbi:MAG: GGDEF domain-containing protein [Devosia nanyangense]|uniref:diguanylate cyclase n=1 Tax=Devosia nanyangense TaxID=1228055 RepID=A0A933L4L8_9HYPH|nr:GGDEF domain-containing protein [Devosia nanyangense]